MLVSGFMNALTAKPFSSQSQATAACSAPMEAFLAHRCSLARKTAAAKDLRNVDIGQNQSVKYLLHRRHSLVRTIRNFDFYWCYCSAGKQDVIIPVEAVKAVDLMRLT